jgi:hypothetical protein
MIRIEAIPFLAAKLLARLKSKGATRSPRNAGQRPRRSRASRPTYPQPLDGVAYECSVPVRTLVTPAPAGLLPNRGIADATSRP